MLPLLILVELYIIAAYFPTRFPAFVTFVLFAIAALITYILIALASTYSPALPLKTYDCPTHAAVARLVQSEEYKEYERRKGRPSYGFRVSEGVAGELTEKEREIYET